MIAASSATKDAMPHERALQRGLRVGGDGAARSQRRRGQIYRRRKSSITNRSASPHARITLRSIDTIYGSFNNYVSEGLGLTRADIAKLRSTYDYGA
jgi:hypothetical protein